MAVSYVLVSAAAVLIVEAVLLAIYVPRMQMAGESVHRAQQSVVEANRGSALATAKARAVETAASAGAAAGTAESARPGTSDRALLKYVSTHGFSAQPGSTQVLATTNGDVVASSAPKQYPAGSHLPAMRSMSQGVPDGDPRADWAVHPVGIAGSGHRVIGMVYVRIPPPARPQVTEGTRGSGGSKGAGTAQSVDDVRVLWIPAVVVLLLLVPVGGLFGLLSTRWLIRRIRRLAAGTSAMAGGDLSSRIPVSGGDEVGRLEEGFNQMAERLEGAVAAERDAAGSTARRAERTRIAREMHDSISQDLFSASLLAGGLRKALPAGTPLRRQAESMEHTLERTMREMRAMLLELRPVALEDAGLAAAVDELCRAYEARLGIRIHAEVGAPRLEPPVEHAVLRVVQEAVGNAVRHGRPGRIEVSVSDGDGQVAVVVRDDGQGFDQEQVGGRHGLGLGLMRERVAELGGVVDVTSAPEQGTTVEVLIPDGAA